VKAINLLFDKKPAYAGFFLGVICVSRIAGKRERLAPAFFAWM
jgi:hypothetical protein